MADNRIEQLKNRSNRIGMNYAEWAIDHREAMLPSCELRRQRMDKLLDKINVEIYNIQNNTNHKVA